LSYQLARFENVIRNHRLTGPDERILMDRDGHLSVYFIPFDYTNREARVVLVGITPGPNQMQEALPVAHNELRNGASIERATMAAKKTGAFSGPLRSNLVRQLDHWGVDEWLGINGSAALFGTQHHLLQSTSLLRFPVFKSGKGYNGTPDMTKSPLLRKYLLEHFAKEVELLDDPVFLSLGGTVAEGLDWLVERGVIRKDRVFHGLLHPSGNNNYRINYLLGDRQEPAPHMTNATPYDDGRTAFREKMLTAGESH
jgi:hypothetical protein